MPRLLLRLIPICALCFATVALHAQAGLLVDALAQIDALLAETTASPATLAPAYNQIRRALRDAGISDTASLPPPADAGDDAESVREKLRQLRELADAALRKRADSPFRLGRVEVNVTASLQGPTAEIINSEDFRLRNARTVPDALNLVPGVSVQRIGPRNERGVFVRGFDVRQVPLYVDGIPVYVPYDGYVDLDRFLTFDVAEMQVTKGFTSPLYGPNAIGGAINIVSRQPTSPLNLDLGSGFGSGRQWQHFANAGSRWDRFWIQGGFAWLSSDSFPLSGDFSPTPTQPDRNRFNSSQQDWRARLQVAYTPNSSDQYSFGYVRQEGEKGNPPYIGSDPRVRVRFWRWPQWDKESFYFIGNKNFSGQSFVRIRAFHDRFDNFLRSFDDATFTTQTRPFAFNSPYDDDTWGGTLVYATNALRRHALRVSFFFKDDVHREGNLGEPERTFRDQSLSFGMEDTITLGERLYAIVGFSADRLEVLNAQDFRNGQVLPFERNTIWAANPQAGLFYRLGDSGKIHATFARKTRLPTIKDRYSYRLGQAIPNPDLREEIAANWEVGYSRTIGANTFLEANGFWSEIDNSTQRFFLQPNLFQLRNLGQARNRGIEFAGRTMLFSALQLTANYTYLSRRNLSDPSLLLIDTPRHKTYTSAHWQALSRLAFMADLHYEAGRQNQNEAGLFLRAPQFANAGLSAFAELTPSLQLQTGIQNLADRNYFLVEGYPEPGRTWFLNLRYRIAR